MLKTLGAVGAILLGLAGSAQAATRVPVTVIRTTTVTDLRPHVHKAEALPPVACPAGVPTQAITVVNQAHVGRFALARVENAMVDQSMQLRAAWGTPCVQFGPGGWPLYLRIGGTEWGAHYTQPVRAEVYTAGLSYIAWSQAFSHEIVEMLVDPSTVNAYYDPAEGEAGTNYGSVEIADPVEERAYKLAGVWVSDFVFPAYFAGALQVPAVGCDPAQNVPCGPPLAAADAAAPYDQMAILTGPWQTQWGRTDS